MADSPITSTRSRLAQSQEGIQSINNDNLDIYGTSDSSNGKPERKPYEPIYTHNSSLVSNILSNISGNENYSSLLSLLTKAEKDVLEKIESEENLKISNEAECLKICPEIIPRSAWRSRKPKQERVQLMRSVPPVLFKRTTANECKTKEECLKAVKWMQIYHMEVYEFPDIAHSFLIGEDGNVYEGRGWGYQNQQGPGFVGIGYIGYYPWDSDNQPTRAMKRTAFRLILCGVQKGFIKNPFKKGIKTLPNGLPDPDMWDKYLLQADDEY